MIETARRRAISCMLVSAGLAVLLPIAGRFDVAFLSYWPMYLMASLFATFLPLVRWRGMDRLASGLETIGMMFLISASTIIITYGTMRLNMPMADEMLGRMDQSLGLSSIETIRWANRHPDLDRLLGYAYSAFLPQTLLLGPVLAIALCQARAYQFVTGFIILTILSAIVSIGFPSHGAIIGQGHLPAEFAYIAHGSAQGFIKTFDAVRNDAHFILTLENSSGIVTFPSIHAGVAILCAWAAWPSPILRIPITLLNGFMFASAVTTGSHYVVDVIAGGLIALISITLASRRNSASLGLNGLALPAPPEARAEVIKV